MRKNADDCYSNFKTIEEESFKECTNLEIIDLSSCIKLITISMNLPR